VVLLIVCVVLSDLPMSLIFLKAVFDLSWEILNNIIATHTHTHMQVRTRVSMHGSTHQCTHTQLDLMYTVGLIQHQELHGDQLQKQDWQQGELAIKMRTLS
jgi:hypothetical protein